MDLLFQVSWRNISGRVDRVVVPNASNNLFRPSFIFLFLFDYLLIVRVEYLLEVLLGHLMISVRLQNGKVVILFSFPTIPFVHFSAIFLFLVRIELHADFDQPVLELLSKTVEGVTLSMVAIFWWHKE